jgi:N-acetyl-gamma-glutamyl-phosphate reductase
MAEKIGVAILGGTGYGAGELLRLFAGHPSVEIVSVVSRSSAGQSITATHPQLRAIAARSFDEAINIEQLTRCKHSFIFTALPHGTSPQTISELVSDSRLDGVKFIDLGGDFRLQDDVLQGAYYPDNGAAPRALRSSFTYGLPELNREQIVSARFIANPGCYATTCILAVLPLVSNSFRSPIHFDAKSGTSGAGRAAQAQFHHPELHGNFVPYKVLEHRHEPEIRQALGDPRGERIQTMFVPQLIPVARGIYVTAYLTLEQEQSTAQLLSQFHDCFKHSPFVRVTDDPPQLANVVGTNFCDISVRARGRQVVCMATLDNLVKGMAGQAIQNMNLMCGLSETTGLMQSALRPI